MSRHRHDLSMGVLSGARILWPGGGEQRAECLIGKGPPNVSILEMEKLIWPSVGCSAFTMPPSSGTVGTLVPFGGASVSVSLKARITSQTSRGCCDDEGSRGAKESLLGTVCMGLSR